MTNIWFLEKGAPAVRRQPKGQYTRQFLASLPI